MPQPRFHRLVPALILEGPEPASEVPESGLGVEPELDPEPEEDPDPELEPDPEPELDPDPDPDPDPELESTPPSELLELEEELPQAARTPAVRRATPAEGPVRLATMSFSLTPAAAVSKANSLGSRRELQSAPHQSRPARRGHRFAPTNHAPRIEGEARLRSEDVRQEVDEDANLRGELPASGKERSRAPEKPPNRWRPLQFRNVKKGRRLGAVTPSM